MWRNIPHLDETLWFPSPENAGADGLLAYGGDLQINRLLLAYRNGIFPWPESDSHLAWYCTHPRTVLLPEKITVSKSMRQILRSGRFKITYDTAFGEVIQACRRMDQPEESTWITEELAKSFLELHEMGLAHSVETWREGKLVGGLYGLALGKVFFGESMFTKESNASKAALIYLSSHLEMADFVMIDCQQVTRHLLSMGAVVLDRGLFLKILKVAVQQPGLNGKWTGKFPFSQSLVF